jgi:hypothetical protein
VLFLGLALASIAVFALSACGSDDDNGSSSDASAPESTVESAPTVDPNAPLTQQLKEVFPPPEPLAGSPPKAEAFIKQGQKACKGKTPSQVVDEFLPAAEENKDYDKQQLELISEIGSYEENPTSDFAAGQIAAGVYEATLPELQQRSGYQGCVYELALHLRRELASSKG